MRLRLLLYHQALQQRLTSSSSIPTHLHLRAQQGQANGRGEATRDLVPDAALCSLGTSFAVSGSCAEAQCAYILMYLCMHVW